MANRDDFEARRWSDFDMKRESFNDRLRDADQYRLVQEGMAGGRGWRAKLTTFLAALLALMLRLR